jgi:hypothetical protein
MNRLYEIVALILLLALIALCSGCVTHWGVR